MPADILTTLAAAWDDITSLEAVGVIDLERDTYGLWTVEVYGEEWIIGTDSEADDAAAEYIKDSLWAFNMDFLVGYFLPDGAHIEGVIKALQEWQQKRCEDCNDDIRGMVGDRLNDLIEDAISADGRGHFLAPYDFEEHSVETPSGDRIYCYRIN